MWDSLNWERTNRKTSANGHFLIRMEFFFKRKKNMLKCFSQVEMLKIKNNLSRREVLSLAVVEPTDPTAKWEPEKIGFRCQIQFASWKRISRQNRLQAQNKKHSDLHSLLSSVLIIYVDRELLWDNRRIGTGVCFGMSFPMNTEVTTRRPDSMYTTESHVTHIWCQLTHSTTMDEP